MRVIGTAGHVDHGKSTLVHALTGIDPDRLQEEKEREMTIDLGFAWLALPDGQTVGVIDVPGHIDFIKNMLAGVGGIDAALLVVAADEGVMPQTKEHLAILDLLQVPAGVVALTKVDLAVEAGWLDLIEADLRDTLAGTCLARAPIVPVSARTGEGLDRLRQALADVLAEVPTRLDKGQPRLPIDRVFSIAGFGTVVTGTLVDGQFRLGDEIEITPGGLRARVRGLQTHGHALEKALPGSRLAMNLTGVHPNDLTRGLVVALPGHLSPTTLVDVRVRTVAGGARSMAGSQAPGVVRGHPAASLRHDQLVDFFTGAAEVPARVRLLDADEIPPGGSGWVQLRLQAPVSVAAADRFIIRQASPSRTLGGGQVANAHPGRRWRRFQADVVARLETLARGTPEDLLLHALTRGEPAALKAVVERSALEAARAETALAGLLASGQIILLGSASPPLASSTTPALSRSGWNRLAERMAEILAEFHAQYPLRTGMAREELRSRVQGRERWSARLFNELTARAVAQGVLAEHGEVLAQTGRKVEFNAAQQQQVNALLSAFRRQPYTPPSAAESVVLTDAEIISALVEGGVLVRLNEDVLMLNETYDLMVGRIVAHIGVSGSITVSQVRDLFNTSRKYALALMEHLDAQKVTRRIGDERVLRAS